MFETSPGLILRVRPLTETSLIVHWLTPGLGRISTVAKGALRPKSPFRGKLDIFFEANFSFVRSRRSDLHTLREVVLADTHAGLRRDLGLLQQAAYAVRFVEQATETETPLHEVFTSVVTFIRDLPLGPVRPETILGFELKLLAILGLAPDPATTRLSPAAKEGLEWLAGTIRPVSETKKLDPGTVKELDQFLHGYLIYHLERLPAGRSAALHGI